MLFWNIMSWLEMILVHHWEPKTTFGRYFFEIIVQVISYRNIKSARCNLLLERTTFICEMLVFFFIKSLSFEMYGVVTRFFLKSPLSQTLEETQLSRLLITDSVRWTVFSDVEFSTTKVFLRYFTSTSWPKKHQLKICLVFYIYGWNPQTPVINWNVPDYCCQNILCTPIWGFMAYW